MLEAPALLLRPPGPNGTRLILHAGSGQPLGFACWLAGERSWRWLAGPVLEVHEEDDAPLLLTVRQRWWWSARHEVRDAEGSVVGSLVKRFILNEFNRWIASSNWAGENRLSLDNPKREPLAELEVTRDGVRLD